MLSSALSLKSPALRKPVVSTNFHNLWVLRPACELQPFDTRVARCMHSGKAEILRSPDRQTLASAGPMLCTKCREGRSRFQGTKEKPNSKRSARVAEMERSQR